MRKTIMIILTGLVIFIYNNQNIMAGCGPICLSTQQNWYPNSVDSVYLDQNSGSVTMYATYSSCCLGMLNILTLIWYKDGVPCDTTDFSDAELNGQGVYVVTCIVTQPGLYEVFYQIMQGESGCGKVCVLRTEGIQSVPITQPFTQPAASIVDEEVKNGYRIYPNPTSEGYFYIDYPTDLNINNIEVYNLGGQKILSVVPNGSEIVTINTSNFRPGMYIIRIDSEVGIVNKKILVK